MTIAVIMQSPDIGGSETFMLNLVREWIKNGDRVIALTNYDELKRRFKRYGAQVDDLHFNLDLIGNIRGFIKTLLALPFAITWYFILLMKLRSEVDVIVMSNFTEKMLVTFLADKLNVKVVWFEYPPLEKLLKRNLEVPKYIYLHLQHIPSSIITISKNSLNSLKNKTGISENKLELIYPGSRVPSDDELQRSKKKAKLLKKDSGVQGKTVIGNISRIAKEKSQERIIKIMPYLLSKYPNLALIFVGRGPDEKRLKKLVYDLGLNDSVFFLGFVEKKLRYYSMMDIFVFPSSWELEGFGLVLVEAMMMKIPIVAVNSGPTSEIIKDSKTGLLAEADDQEQMIQAISYFLDNPRKARALAERARKQAKQRFNIKKSANQIRKRLLHATGNASS